MLAAATAGLCSFSPDTGAERLAESTRMGRMGVKHPKAGNCPFWGPVRLSTEPDHFSSGVGLGQDSGCAVRDSFVPHSGHTPDTLPVRLYPQLTHYPFRRRHQRRQMRSGPQMNTVVG